MFFLEISRRINTYKYNSFKFLLDKRKNKCLDFDFLIWLWNELYSLALAFSPCSDQLQWACVYTGQGHRLSAFCWALQNSPDRHLSLWTLNSDPVDPVTPVQEIMVCSMREEAQMLGWSNGSLYLDLYVFIASFICKYSRKCIRGYDVLRVLGQVNFLFLFVIQNGNKWHLKVNLSEKSLADKE